MTAIDKYAHQHNLQFPSVDYGPITPSNTEDLVNVCRAIRANTAGTIKLTRMDGEIVICNFAAGETRPLRAVRIWAADTTATDIEVM